MPARKGIKTVKEILKTWYFNANARGYHRSFILYVAACLVISLILALPFIFSLNKSDVIMGYMTLALLSIIALMAFWLYFIAPFYMIFAFKRRFSFLPPLTNEGRIAMQSNVDFELHQSARRFFLMCDEEKKLVSLLTDISGLVAKSELLPHEIREIEIKISKLRETIQKLKKAFWRKHAVAKSGLLPVSFEVLPSIHNYETCPPKKTLPKKPKKSGLANPTLSATKHFGAP